MSFFRLLLLILLGMCFPSWSSLPYEANCSQNRINNTNHFISSDTEANFCSVCGEGSELYDDLENLGLYDTIPKECFLAIATRGNQKFKEKRYNYCSSENNQNPVRGSSARFCINEDYVTAIHSSFRNMSYCFDLDRETQTDLFYMINHESAGILNVRSRTGARCLGQITCDYVKDINNVISTADRSRPHADSVIWREALQRCPNLENFRIRCPGSSCPSACPTLTCASTQNPDKCLLYSFFGPKRSMLNIQERLDRPGGHMGNREFPSPETLFPNDDSKRTQYQNMLNLLPVKGKEMLVVRRTGGRTLVFWDDSEAYRYVRNSDFWDDVTSVEKVDIFENERDLLMFFTYWAHNGGQSLHRDSFTRRLEQLKQCIARTNCTRRTALTEEMRDRIEGGEKIPSSMLLEYFESDLRRTYAGKTSRKIEVSEYVRKVINDRSKVFNAVPGSEDYNVMAKYYKNNDISEDRIEAFMRESEAMCPRSLDIRETGS